MFKKIKKGFKAVIKYIKRLIKKIKFRINPKSVSKKDRKKFRKEQKVAEQYSNWGNFLRWITGCNNLKVDNCCT